jgi:asparagine synthase (glutamine-hydrolysing)
MCGIVGFVGNKNDKILKAMGDAIKHRGPDGEGFYYCSENNVNLGHKRLSINDIEGGAQPMSNKKNSVTIVFNGEIYNHAELRKELEKKGYQFKSDHSDTEVIIYGYEEWGANLLNKLSGMFAFCILDRINKVLFFARDRFGKKPLYYSYADKKIVFSSELKSLMLHPEIQNDIDVLAVKKYFAYGFIPAPYTYYKCAKKILPGHYMIFNLINFSLSTHKYWEFKVDPNYNLLNKAEDDLACELKNLLTSAVKKRMKADVPVGIFLSGGVDSSSILACASTEESRIKTFSIGFKEKFFDESSTARDISDLFNSEHYEQIVELENVKKASSDILRVLDEPMGDSSILPTYFLAKFAKKHISVALSGDGGDELFCGYEPFRALKSSQFYCDFFPKKMRLFISNQVRKLPASESYLSFDFKLKRTLEGLNYHKSIWNPVWLSPLLPNEISELMNEKVSIEEIYGDAIDAWESSEADNSIDKSIEYYGKFYLQNGVLTKVDRASMMVGLEVRSPFLDNDVVKFALNLPNSFKYKKGVTKYLLKKSMEGIIPCKNLYQQKKGFALPLTAWLKSWPLDNIKHLNLNYDFVSEMGRQHRYGKRDNRLFIWNWIVLSEYMKNN